MSGGDKNLGLVDKRAYLQVLGGLLKDHMLIDDIDRPLDKKDFWSGEETLYQLLYVSIHNLYMQGCQVIDEYAIDSYLSKYNEQYKVFQDNNGIMYVESCIEMAELENYDMYYHTIRKLSLLRYYESQGLDTRFIYDTTKVNPEDQNAEQMKFENYSEQDIVEKVENIMVVNPSLTYCKNGLTTEVQAGYGALELVKQFTEIPDVGLPMCNTGLNTIARGARDGCLFMRSAPSGGGKSRMLAGDACRFAVPWVYDDVIKEWYYTGISEPTLYITTEMSHDEIQTLLFACVSKVNEEHILNGTYEGDEYDRVCKAIQYIEESPLYIVHIPDFSIEDIKNIIKKYYSQFGIKYYVFDYIFASPRLMTELNAKNHLGLKEHQILLVFATELKAIAQTYNIFIFTASQLTREAVDAKYKDQTLLAGAVALCNKLDVGIISIRPNTAEKKKLDAIMKNMINMPYPDMGHWVYKVRRGKLTKIIVWSKSDFGTMSEQALFVTDFDFNLIDVNFTQIESVEKAIIENSKVIRAEDLQVQEAVSTPEEMREIKSVSNFDW